MIPLRYSVGAESTADTFLFMLHLAHPGHALIHVKAGLLAQGVAAIPAFPVSQWHNGDACLMTVAGAAMD